MMEASALFHLSLTPPLLRESFINIYLHTVLPVQMF
jgi:hypothetical protein